jgi:AcrR family transcriptional regulator
MGNREDLLAGAKRCLYEKGYAHTTARDIATASGVSLAAIGYHYGSTEALLNAALIQALEDWGNELGRTLAVGHDHDATPMQRFESYWTRVIESFASHRHMLVGSVEALAQIDRAPEVRRVLAEGLRDSRALWALLFQNIDAATEEKKALAVGSFYQALLSGVIVQWLIDPEHAPSGRDLADTLRTIAADITADNAAPDTIDKDGPVNDEDA